MIKKIYNSVALQILVSICFTFCVSAAEFAEGMEDIPIMQGLVQIQNNNVSFGNEETRFIEIYVSGKGVKFDEVSSFYKNTLPQLGWKFKNNKGGVLHFERDMEVLDIAREEVSPLLVRITLKSKN